MTAMGAEEAVTLRRAVSRLARKLNAAATDEGLTPSQASVLALIGARGPIGVPELVQLEHLHPTMLSRVIGALDQAGYLIRRSNPNDLRAASLELTDEGHQVDDRIREQRAGLVLKGLSMLPIKEQRAVRSALTALSSLADVLP